MLNSKMVVTGPPTPVARSIVSSPLNSSPLTTNAAIGMPPLAFCKSGGELSSSISIMVCQRAPFSSTFSIGSHHEQAVAGGMGAGGDGDATGVGVGSEAGGLGTTFPLLGVRGFCALTPRTAKHKNVTQKLATMRDWILCFIDFRPSYLTVNWPANWKRAFSQRFFPSDSSTK